MGIRFSLLGAPCVLSLLACGAPVDGGEPGGPFGNSTGNSRMPVGGGSSKPPVVMNEPPPSCGATSVAAEEVVVEEEVTVETEVTVAKPVALYVMFDKSLSMDQSGLWEPAVDAMDAFLTADASKGLRVGLQYFPNGGSCSVGGSVGFGSFRCA